MTDEQMKNNEELINLAFSKQIKIHISLKDKTWRNGYVRELSADFFMFEDKENGIEPIFFLELHNVEPFMEGEK